MKNPILPMLGATVFAAMAPMLFASSKTPNPLTTSFPGWPNHYENKHLTALDLTEKERVFVQGFPGEVGRFSDGTREIIIRWVESPTRWLHPAADCFKGVGYAISPLPVHYNLDDVAMGCFLASKNKQSLRVCEYVIDAETDDKRETWSDVPSWYWQAILSDDDNSWWSVVVAENL